MESSMSLILGVLYMAAMAGIVIFWVMSLIDILKSEFEGGSGTKIIWLLVVFFLQILGAVIYHFVGKKQKVVVENNNELAVS